MASLKTLLEQRNQQKVRGVENLRGGIPYYFTHTDSDTSCCQFCWISPGAGVAVVELWGASGTGSNQCCCGWGAGLPGNPGAYSKKTVPVTSNTYICGWVGCSTIQTFGNVGRSGCSVACIFCAPTNYTLIAQGGFGGYGNCLTSTAAYCCFVSQGYCNTLTNSFCGIICNVGGPSAATAATASGGDVNLSGGISCTWMRECYNCYPYGYHNTLAISPGIYTSTGPACVFINRGGSQLYMSGSYNQSGRAHINIAVNSLAQNMPYFESCWSGSIEGCCYATCSPTAVGVPGLTAMTGVNCWQIGVRGGQGAIRITYYQ